MFGSDSEMRIYAILLCCGLSVFFFIRFPSALGILGFTSLGLGPELIFGNIHYGVLVVMIQFAAAAALLWRVWRLSKFQELAQLVKQCRSLYAICLGVVWAEILIVSYMRPNVYRLDSLKCSIYDHWLPMVILVLAYLVQKREAWCLGILYGLAGYAVAYSAPVIPVIYLDGRFLTAAVGAERLTTYLQDTINGDHMFFCGSLGFFGLVATAKKQFGRKVLYLACGSIFLIFMQLNGTRQFIVGLVFAGMIYGWKMRAGAPGKMIFAGLAAFTVLGLASSATKLAAGSSRFALDSLAEEGQVGKGVIWEDAVMTGFMNPITGAGFREFGIENLVVDQDTQMLNLYKDGAHGFFQTMTAEHGAFLFIVTFSAWSILMVKLWSKIGVDSKAEFGVYAFIAGSMMSENFSCGCFNAFGYHVLVLLPILTGAETAQVWSRGSSKSALVETTPETEAAEPSPIPVFDGGGGGSLLGA